MISNVKYVSLYVQLSHCYLTFRVIHVDNTVRLKFLQIVFFAAQSAGVVWIWWFTTKKVGSWVLCIRFLFSIQLIFGQFMAENKLLIDHQLKMFSFENSRELQIFKRWLQCGFTLAYQVNKEINFDTRFYPVPGSLCRRMLHYIIDEKQLWACEKL